MFELPTGMQARLPPVQLLGLTSLPGTSSTSSRTSSPFKEFSSTFQAAHATLGAPRTSMSVLKRPLPSELGVGGKCVNVTTLSSGRDGGVLRLNQWNRILEGLMQACCFTLRTRCAAITVASVLVAGATSSSHGQILRTVALSGQPAPGPPGFRFGGHFGRVLINDAGDVAIQVAASGPFDPARIWVDHGAGLALVAHSAMQAPGLAVGATFGDIDNLVLGNGGHIAFMADRGIWSTKNGVLEPVALLATFPFFGIEGPAPYSLLNASLAINRDGNVAFTALSIIDSQLKGALWSDHGGSAAVELRDGGQAPGMPPGTEFYALSLSTFALNDAGHVVFEGAADPVIAIDGIWVDRGAGFELAVGEDMPAPGAPGAVFGGQGGMALNSQGDFAFRATLRPAPGGGDVSANNNQGFWVASNGSLQLVVRKGDSAPGISGGAFYDFTTSSVDLNDSGKIVFTSLLAGPGIPGLQNSIWTLERGVHKLLARSDEQVPGAPAGVVFQSIASPSINAAGQVAFQAGIIDGGDSRGYRDSLWATDRFGILRLIARRGETIDVDPGPGIDVREVLEVRLGGDVAFNDRGQMAFSARFTDGTTGAFVSNLVAVPEPGGVVLLSVAGIAWSASRPRSARARKRKGKEKVSGM